MSNNRKRPIPTHPKLRGEWAELQFMARAAALGFRIARPISDCYRWDLIVEHELGFHRVQVKCTSSHYDRGYKCRNYGFKKQPYTAAEIDFLAVYIIPIECWYIIPISDLTTVNAYIRTEPMKVGPGKWDKYREAWHLLREPGRFNINASADVQWLTSTHQLERGSAGL